MAEPITIRWACVKRLMDQLRASPDLAGVQVVPGYPGDELAAESIWVDELDGDIDVPVSKSANGVIARDDNFTIPLEVRVSGLTDLDRTMERLSALVAAIEYVFAVDTQLDQLDGVVTARITSERMTAGQITALGYVAFAEVVVSVYAASR